MVHLGIVSIIAVVVSALTLASFIKVGHSAFFGPINEEHKNIEDVPAFNENSNGSVSLRYSHIWTISRGDS